MHDGEPRDVHAEVLHLLGGGEPAPAGEGDEDELQRRERQRRLFFPGGAILDAAPAPEPVWGAGSEVLASKGEPMIITGGIGAGKTTLLGHLVRARIGLADQVLGWPVEEGGRVLYLACDRPRQIMRNMRRLYSEADRTALNERLLLWKGPLPRDLGTSPHIIREMAATFDLGPGDTVIVDGIKDVARDLTKDETGSAINNAFQLCVADGIELWANHHQRKAVNGAGAHRPKSLADVYGSTWITAGAGTVLLLWADRAGSGYVELSTLKPAADEVGPVLVHHDLDSGALRVEEGLTVEAHLMEHSHTTRTVAEIVIALGGDPKDRNQVERVRRRLARLESGGAVEVIEHTRPGGGKPSHHYRWKGAS